MSSKFRCVEFHSALLRPTSAIDRVIDIRVFSIWITFIFRFRVELARNKNGDLENIWPK